MCLGAGGELVVRTVDACLAVASKGLGLRQKVYLTSSFVCRGVRGRVIGDCESALVSCP